MAKYVVSEPKGPFRSIVTSTGEVVALQILSEKWARRIAEGLRMLDAAEAHDIRKAEVLTKLLLHVNQEYHAEREADLPGGKGGA